MRNIGHFLVRVSSFLRKEVFNLLRQPRLVATLILGPFLILLLFGVGYRDEAPAIRTVFVIDEGNPMRPYVAGYAAHLGPQLVFTGLTNNASSALLELERGKIDAVAMIPSHTIAELEQGENVVVEIFHSEIMPRQAGYIDFTMGYYLNALNRRVVSDQLEKEQSRVASAQADVAAAKTALTQIRDQVAQAELIRQQTDVVALRRRLDELRPAMETMTDTLDTVGVALPQEEQAWLQETAGLLLAVDQDLQALETTEPVVSETQMETLSETIAELDRVQTLLTTTQALNPSVILSPFEVQVQNVNAVTLEMTDFYTPGVLALLIQHLAITFAALSIVQEERLGALEVFQIAPLSPAEALIGKYLSYLLFNAIIAVVLSALVIFGLDVPMLGSWPDYAIVILGVTFTSLGIGFLVSLLVRTTSQAVQAGMMLLLCSVFFTGFFQGLDSLRRWLRVLSWSLPTTYGIQHLQDIMLRGRSPTWPRFYLLVATGLLLFGLNLVLLSRKMLPRRN